MGGVTLIYSAKKEEDWESSIFFLGK